MGLEAHKIFNLLSFCMEESRWVGDLEKLRIFSSALSATSEGASEKAKPMSKQSQMKEVSILI